MDYGSRSCPRSGAGRGATSRRDLLEESDELGADAAACITEGPIEHAQRREQSGGAMAFVVVRHRAAVASLQRQARSGSMNLAFLVNGEHQGPSGGWIEADHVVELLDELFVATDLERPNKMGLAASRCGALWLR